MATTTTLSRRDAVRLSRLRLTAQKVAPGAGPALTPSALVRHLFALQAQDLAAATWAVAVRSPGTTETDVGEALREGSIVRSWPMRGTLHLVAPEDLDWMLRLTAPRTIASAAPRFAETGLTARMLDLAAQVAHDRLAGGRALTRAELVAALAEEGVPTAGQGGYHCLWFLAHSRVICAGPPSGKQQTFVLLDEWAQNPRRIEGDEALGEMAARYFVGHGPATVRDFAWWASLTLAQARRGLAVAEAGLASITVGDTVYHLSPELLDSGPLASASGVFLLPSFDEMLLGYQDRSATVPPEHLTSVVPGKNGLFLPVIVAGGTTVATWRRTIARDHVDIIAAPFTTMSSTVKRGYERGARAYARYLGASLMPSAYYGVATP
ncbi:winged helix DNA-binding domain-containing protein [Homoserinimonas hongtaonis]|uniref:winged helix DNA-binding domain-containing protein n=1 Tax=Homoserinimonas hongtaonis TaxID=2079791 RepID=UPI000D3A2EE3|nr:winged helix DNA-binding domain-containing protein [Salinibacterium hongtaonis]AWB89425.1 winged helix DNA-binding domain-containing protein [Salinibacterium hongtaonis]